MEGGRHSGHRANEPKPRRFSKSQLKRQAKERLLRSKSAKSEVKKKENKLAAHGTKLAQDENVLKYMEDTDKA